MKKSNNFYKLKKISTAILTLLIIVSFFPQIIASTQNDTNTIKTNNLLNNQPEKNIKLGSYTTFNKLLNHISLLERILSLPIFNKIINSKFNNINTDNNPGSFSSDRCELCLTKEADLPNACVGDTITYTYNLTNCVGGLTLYCVSLIDDKLGILLDNITLDPYVLITVTKTYTVQESDLPGPIINTATAIGYEPTCTNIEATTTATETVPLTCQPCINLTKEADVDSACVDDVITYTFTVGNCGDLTLYDVNVMDDKLGSITLGDTTLDPDETTTGTATYIVTENDLPGPIVNNAIATGYLPTGGSVTDSDSLSIPIICEPCINLTKEADVDSACVDDVITYTFTVGNCGDLTLYDVNVMDDKLGSITLGDTTLDPDETTTGTATYIVTENDLPGPIVNNAIATGYLPTGGSVTDSDSLSIPLICEPCIELTKLANVETADVDDIITYTYTVKNCGDLTLYNVNVMDDKLGPITLGDTTLDPDETTTGTATYIVTENDCPDPIINTAIATGTPPYGENVSDTDSETVTLLCCECEETVYIDDNFNPGTPDWLITHFNIKQLALDHLEYGTAIVYDGIYHENILIDDIPCCDNTGITQKGEYGCFPIDESAIIDGSETIKVNNVTIKYLEYTPNLDGSIIIFPDICGTILRCNKFNKDCYNEAIGVLSHSNCGVNARLNWWGAPDGPQGGYMDDGLIANGEGVKVIGLVDVEPWIGIHAEINQPPDPTTIELGEPIHFDASGSWAYTYGECCQNPKELPLQYLWDFGDGRLSPNKSPIHIYTEPGTYEVTLTVDAPGIPGLYPNIMFDWAYVTIHVTTENTTLSCNADGGNLGGYETIINEPLQLFGDAYGGNGEYTWHWNFGDQTSDSNQQNPIHTYTKPGTYTAKLTVLSAGKTATDTVQVTVYDIDELFININDANAIVGIETLFTATVKGGIPPYIINWDFGDQITSQENNPTHIYNSSGAYTVTVTVTDNKQKTATDTATITVEEQKIIEPAEIKQVQGGLGIKATINAGDNECNWEIIVNGKYILSGGHKTGTINPNEQQIIKLGYSTRAYGKVYITVKAEDTTKEYNAFALGPFFFNLKQS